MKEAWISCEEVVERLFDYLDREMDSGTSAEIERHLEAGRVYWEGRTMVAILGYSPQQITRAVQDMYTAVADMPDSNFHFPVGREAFRFLGYAVSDTDPIPAGVAKSFAGVGNPFTANTMKPGDTALDIGAGAGNLN